MAPEHQRTDGGDAAPWGPGNFDSTAALITVDHFVDHMLMLIDEVLDDEKTPDPLRRGESDLMPTLSLLIAAIAESGECPVTPKEARRWRRRYLAWFRLHGRKHYPAPAAFKRRRQVIIETFGRLENFAVRRGPDAAVDPAGLGGRPPDQEDQDAAGPGNFDFADSSEAVDRWVSMMLDLIVEVLDEVDSPDPLQRGESELMPALALLIAAMTESEECLVSPDEARSWRSRYLTWFRTHGRTHYPDPAAFDRRLRVIVDTFGRLEELACRHEPDLAVDEASGSVN